MFISYDYDDVQFKPRHIHSSKEAGGTATRRPKAKLPTVRQLPSGHKHITWVASNGTYRVAFNRRTCQFTRSGIKSLESAIEIRDEQMKKLPKKEFGKNPTNYLTDIQIGV